MDPEEEFAPGAKIQTGSAGVSRSENSFLSTDPYIRFFICLAVDVTDLARWS